MIKQKPENQDLGTYEVERCLECGIHLKDGEFAEIDGDTLCEQCAEEHMREPDSHEPAASQDEFSIERGARIH